MLDAELIVNVPRYIIYYYTHGQCAPLKRVIHCTADSG